MTKIPAATLVLLALATRLFAFEVSPDRFKQAADYSRERRGFSLVVMQHDKVVFEKYEDAPGEPHKIYSGTKAFWVMAALAAVNDGLLSLDERVCDTITEWKNDPRKRRIRVRQLLDFTDGIEPASFLHGDGIADRNRIAINLPLVAEPGARFMYGPAHLQIFDELLRRKLASRGEGTFDYLEKKVLRPLGLGRIDYKKDAAGNPLLATGFKLTARQWLRMGVLLLHRGSYEGRVVVPAGLFNECLQPSVANPAFGLGMWLNREARSSAAREPDIENLLELKWYQPNWDHVCFCRDAPADMFVSLGSGYQRLYVIPSLDLIVLRQGLDAKFSDAAFLRILLGR